jgi:precorrin-3B synthase
MAEFAADVMLLAQPGGAAVRVSVGDAAVRVRAEDGPPAMLLAAEAFLDAASATGTRAWRVRELPRSGAELADVPAWREHFSGPVGSVDAVGPGGPVGSGVPEGAAVSRRGLRPPAPAPQSPAGLDMPGPRPGPVAGGGVSVGVPFGRLTVAAWRALARVAQAHGTGELRVTPWRGVVVPGAGPEQLDVLAGAGLVTDPASPWLGVGACTGRPGCAKSLADVRADATAHLAAGAGGLPVHWSGCERRCGHPRGAWADVVATDDGRYEVSAPGAPPRAVPLPELADALAAARTTTKTPTKAPTK